MKPTLLLQDHLFSEDEFQDTKSVIQEHFQIQEIECQDLWMAKEYISDAFRGSLHLARILGYKFEFANALKFMPYFRGKIIDYFTEFNDLSVIQNVFFNNYPYKRFIRPISPFKEFAGNTFSEEEFKSEYKFLISKNIDPYLICAVGQAKELGREWRCIFIEGKYISGSQYLNKGDLEIKSEVPTEVIEYAQKMAQDQYFLNIPTFVLDICEVDGNLALVEINGFETASFYAADLDKIYSTWAKWINLPF